MPYIYRYTDLADNKIKYVGLVYEDSRTRLCRRLVEHTHDCNKKSSPWSKYKKASFKIEVLGPDQVKTKNDAEMLEAHFIATYETFNEINDAKKTWGRSSFIDNSIFHWEEIPEQEITSYLDIKTGKQDTIKSAKAEAASWKRKYEILEEVYKRDVDKLKGIIANLEQRLIDVGRPQYEVRSECIKAGIKKARDNGKIIGGKKGVKLVTQKQKKCVDIIYTYAKECGGTLNNAELLLMCQCNRNTFFKYKRIAIEQYNLNHNK